MRTKPEIRLEADLISFLEGLGSEDRVGIDMPIGLLDVARTGGRDCDQAARALLRPLRHSSVFSAPSREVLAAPDWDAARSLGLSKQAWNLVPKIRELDEWISPQRQRQVAEFHPELCFRSLLGRPAAHPKRTAEGAEERRAAMPRSFENALIEALGRTPRKLAQPDDLVDALGVLLRISAWRDDTGLKLPGPRPPEDVRGIRMEIRG